jgi:hypothetical protein
MKRKVHRVEVVIGGAFKTSCGIYLAGEAKEYGTAWWNAVTCKHCLKKRKKR